MISLGEARAFVLSKCSPIGSTTVDVHDAVGAALAADVVSVEAVPPFANTAMDGFAVRAADTAGATADAPVRLNIAGTIAAGAVAERALEAGEAMRIMTGAPMPDGADAVVMVERTEVDGDSVAVQVEVPVANHIRPVGDDIGIGDVVFRAGEVVTPGHLGVLLSIGVTEVEVMATPVVGVLSTGDELVGAGQPLGPGQIRDSNRATLIALLTESGFETRDLGLIADDEAAIEEALRSGAASCDAVVTSGGVSMGDFDFVKAVLSRIADMQWMQVAIRPAKPLAFGTLDGTPIFGLPGNPVSSMVSFELFARPGLRAMSGIADIDRRHISAAAAVDMPRRPDGKRHFVRVRTETVDGSVAVRPAGGQGSHQLTAMAAADGLAIFPSGVGFVAGEEIEVMLLR